MSCNPVCYDLAPTGYDAGIYSRQYIDDQPTWFYPPDADGMVRVVTTPALITELNTTIDPDKIVKCQTSGSGLTGDVSSLQQYQRCYSTGNGLVLLHGWAKPPVTNPDNSVSETEVLITGQVIQSDDPLIPITSNLSTLDMTSWTPSTGCCGSSDGGTTTPPPDPSIRCYNREVPVSEPTSKPNNVANKGYVEQTLWTIQQFVDAGNVGASDSDFSAVIGYDTDGIPEYDGEYVKSNITTLTHNEGSTYGSLIRHEGYIYNPIRYPDTNAGKYVTKAELADTYTGTAQADYSQLYIASNGGNYTLDRADLKLADDNAAPGSSVYTLDPSQRGEYMRFAHLNGDAGGASQFNLQMRLTYADGSIQTLAMTNFLHQVGTLAYHAETELEPLVFNQVSGEWTKDGNTETVDTALGNLKATPCGQLPITYSVWSEAGTVVFSGEFGGSGEGYEYSIDGGKTFQASATFDLSESGALEIVPTVRDSNGTLSGKSNLSTHFPCIEKSWAADLTSPAVNDTFYDDGAGNRGWNVVYSTQLGSNQLEALNSPDNLNWVLDKATQNNSYIYLGQTFVEPDNSAEAELNPVIGTPTSGQVYTVAFNPYNYYHGDAQSQTEFTAEIVDMVTGNVLGDKAYSWTGQTTVNLSNETFSFVGTGNDVLLRFKTENANTTSGDWWGSTNLATLTPDSIIKNGGNGWNVGVMSNRMRKATDGVHMEFNPSGSGNRGMHGIDSDGTTASYAVMDYGFYISSNNRWYVYEDGGQRGTGIFAGGNSTLFEIDVATDGTVTYSVGGAVVYTSSINAGDRSYYVSSHPYTNNTGIDNIVFNGTDTLVIPDRVGDYVRIDNVRLFEGLFSDATHYAKKAGNHYLFFRGIEGQAVYTSDAHGYNVDTTIVPKFDIRRYGTLDDTAGDIDRVTLQYQIDNGSWVTMLEHEGQFDVANEIYLSPFYYEKGVKLSAGEEIRYRMMVDGTGNNAEGYYLYENSDVVRC